MDIAFIAPYERIKIKAQSIIDTTGYPAKTYLGDLHQGVKAARRALTEGAKIIISRGGTARLIRKELGIEVVEVGVSIYRALAYIQEQTTPHTRIAIAGFKQLINLVEPICDILGRSYQSFELKENLSFQTVMNQVAAWQGDIVIGDAVSVHWAKAKGLEAYLIESSMETLVDAFDRAVLVLNNLKRHISNEEKLAAVLNCTKDGAILINQEGIIEEINQQGCQVLRTARMEILGRDISRYLRSQELDTAIWKKQEAKHIFVDYQGKKLSVDYITVAQEDLARRSAVILFQRIERIQEAGNAIRKKLLETGFYAKYTFEDILHRSAVMQHVVEVARQYSLTRSNLMIQGETGTGKELFAQSIHNAGPLGNGPFVAVNCAALSGTLLESELFGYAPGAFTGALRTGKIGLFELAQEGTLFLDELTEMDIFLQSKLLRALQTREIMRIGDNKVIPVNVRVIAATNRDPLEEVQAGRLRADLYYRLNVLDLQIPPLRERGEDAQYLFACFLEKQAELNGRGISGPPASFLKQFNQHSWPGNVREVENMAEKYATLQSLPHNDLVLATLLPHHARGGSQEPQTLNEAIGAHISRAYQREQGNITRTAKRLAVDRNTVKRWLSKQADPAEEQ